jgi:hypothetical protein
VLKVAWSERCSTGTRPRCDVALASVPGAPRAAAASASGPTGACSRGRPRHPKAVTRRPMLCTPGTPRVPSCHANTLRTGGPFSVVRRARVPEASSARPLVTRGYARHLKRGHGPRPRRTPASPPRPSRPPAPSRAAAASSGCEPTASQVAPSPHSLAPKEATEPLHSSPAQTLPELRPQRLPPLGAAAHLAAGQLRPQLRPNPVPSHPSTLPPPFPGQTSVSLARICSARAGQSPQGPHCKAKFLSGGLPAKW